MGPAGMTSSVTSLRSGSELVDSDMESSTHSLSSFTQRTPLATQVVCLLNKKTDTHLFWSDAFPHYLNVIFITVKYSGILKRCLFVSGKKYVMELCVISLPSFDFVDLCQGMVNCSRRYPVAGCLSSLPQASHWTRGAEFALISIRT